MKPVNPMILDPGLVPGGPFRVGDRVRFPFGDRKVEGVVVEDRGPIGVGGRRLYGIAVQFEAADEMTTEVAEDYLETAHSGETGTYVNSGRN